MSAPLTKHASGGRFAVGLAIVRSVTPDTLGQPLETDRRRAIVGHLEQDAELQRQPSHGSLGNATLRPHRLDLAIRSTRHAYRTGSRTLARRRGGIREWLIRGFGCRGRVTLGGRLLGVPERTVVALMFRGVAFGLGPGSWSLDREDLS